MLAKRSYAAPPESICLPSAMQKRSVREELYRAFVTRAGDTNAPLIGKILKLRREQVLSARREKRHVRD